MTEEERLRKIVINWGAELLREGRLSINDFRSATGLVPGAEVVPLRPDLLRREMADRLRELERSLVEGGH